MSIAHFEVPPPIKSDLRPANWCRHASLITNLQAVDDSQNLAGVSPCACWIHHRQPDFLARINDKNAADGEGNAFLINIFCVLRIKHVVSPCNLSIGIGDNREL